MFIHRHLTFNAGEVSVYKHPPIVCQTKSRCQQCDMLMAHSLLSLQVNRVRHDCLKAWECNLGLNVCRAAGSPPPDAFINIHPWSNFAVLPPTVCSAWSSSASRLNPINISYLINKWNNLFSYFWVAHQVAPLPMYAGAYYLSSDIVSVIA